MHARLALPLGLLSTTLLACLSDLSVPEGALIDCKSGEDCPSTHVCSAALGRCVRAGADDQPPSFDAALLSVSPALASASVEVEIRFTPSEVLGAPPGVSLEWSGAEPRQIADVVLQDDGAYLARYLVTGDEPEGFAALAVELVDEDGNRNRSAVPRALELDFTPPTVVGETVGVLLDAAPESPLATVGAAGVGASVRVLFAANEPLAAPPSIRTEDDTPLSFTLTEEIGTFFTFAAVVPAGTLAQGEQALVADLVDVAGNESRVPLGTFTLDTEAPPSPAVDVPEAVTYVRVPWGSGATAGVPSYFLELAPGSVEEGAVVIVRDTDDVAFASELGRTPAFDGAAQVVPLARADREAVWVTAVDGAGNESAPVRVRDVRWTATLIGREARSDLRNPHRVLRSNAPLSARRSPRLSEPTTGELAALADEDGVSLTADGQRGFVRRTLRMPGARILSEMVFDGERGVGVVFGGLQGELQMPADTWEWDGSGWSQRSPSVAPSGRFGHALVYDLGRAEVVSFGGLDLTRHVAETWVYDGTNWTDVTPPGDSPAPRLAAAAAYDSVRGRVVLFGGGVLSRFESAACDTGTALADGSCLLGDTWEWDGNGWHPFAPAVSPPARAMHAMAFDAERGGVVLFGGCTGSEAFSNLDCTTRADDTWLWDGTTWIELTSSAGAPPPARVAHRLLTTPDGPLLVGGAPHGFASEGECDTPGISSCSVPWRLEDSGWTPLTVADPLPLGPFPSVMWDSDRGRLVAMTHTDLECEPADRCNRTLVWTEDESALVVHLEERPTARSGASLVYDELRARAVMFGGDPIGAPCVRSPSAPMCDGLWEWDGSGWDLRCAGTEPGAEDSCATHPDGREGAALAFDAARGTTFLFGGRSAGPTCDGAPNTYCDTTWSWDGTAWSALCAPSLGCTSPSPRNEMAVTYDRDREVVILYGGDSLTDCASTNHYCGDTWEWDGTSWTLVDEGALGPGPRAGAELAYDEARGVAVLFGGRRVFASDEEAAAACSGEVSGANCYFTDTWEWNGSSWTRLTTTDPEGDGDPAPCTNPALAFDAARARVVMHGGHPLVGEYRDDAWELDGHSWRSISLGAASPGARENHGMAFDRARERLVVFGGDGGDEHTWEWPSGASARSSLLVEISFLAADADPALATGVEVRAVGGGRGYTFDVDEADDGDRVGDPVPGAALSIWDASVGRWQPAGTLTGPPDAPTALQAASADAAEARRWLASGSRQLALRLEPSSGEGNGPGSAELGLDYVEVVVRYRLP